MDRLRWRMESTLNYRSNAWGSFQSNLWRRACREARVLVVIGIASGLFSCSNIEPVAPANPPITEPTQLYMSLTLNQRTINIALGQTIQLVATPRDALGNAMTGLPMPTYQVIDTTKVQVTPEGMLTALETVDAPGTRVIVKLTNGPISHEDTVLIRVTSVPSAAALDTLSIDPPPGDSTIWAIDFANNATSLIMGPDILGLFQAPKVVARTVSATGGVVPGLLVDYTSLDSAVAVVNRETGFVTLRRPGRVAMVARTWAYGNTRADTITYTVTMPIAMSYSVLGLKVTFQSADGSNEIKIAPNGIVGWASSMLVDTVDVTFDDPTNVVMPPAASMCDLLPSWVGPGFYCGAGNILLLPVPNGSTDNTHFRQFPIPGIYPFHDTRTGASGRVIVTNAFK